MYYLCVIFLFFSYKPNNCVDFKSNYYLLNPSGDLIDTQLAFQSQFQRLKKQMENYEENIIIYLSNIYRFLIINSTSCWNGITGTGPNVDTL